MTDWTQMVDSNLTAVTLFAEGNLSKDAFREAFSNGVDNPARQVVTKHGAKYARRLARKALRRRGVSV